jgi:uncharacterized protein YqgC (DUF456 family)
MNLDILWWALSLLLVVGGLAGTVVPALPGVPMVFAGLFLAAWVTDFEPVGWGTIAVLGVLTALAWLLDFLAAALGARRLGASQRAFWGATFGAIAGIFFGVPGISRFPRSTGKRVWGPQLGRCTSCRRRSRHTGPPVMGTCTCRGSAN